MARLRYRIREVDGFDGAIAIELEHLHEATFWVHAPPIDCEVGHWWLVYRTGKPIAFAGIQESTYYPGHGYFNRVGVLHTHRGNGLNLRLLKTAELRAKRNGWKGIVSDTTIDNPASANSFIKAGFQIFWPEKPWGLPRSFYWRKKF